MDRKLFLKTTGILGVGLAAGGSVFSKGKTFTPFVPEKLAFDYNALEPYIDATTMNIHYNKHYQTYIDNLNKALPGTAYEGKSIEEIIKSVKPGDKAIRNNAGGYYNHSLFWQWLSPEKKDIPAHIAGLLTKDFGSVDAFKAAFETAGTGVFGSGWAWLLKQKNDKLTIGSTSNQDNPLMAFSEEKGTPVLGVDVWEHAYYLKYQNKRKDYLDNFWNVVNWDRVHELYMG